MALFYLTNALCHMQLSTSPHALARWLEMSHVQNNYGIASFNGPPLNL
jgi:hypothetical protein